MVAANKPGQSGLQLSEKEKKDVNVRIIAACPQLKTNSKPIRTYHAAAKEGHRLKLGYEAAQILADHTKDGKGGGEEETDGKEFVKFSGKSKPRELVPGRSLQFTMGCGDIVTRPESIQAAGCHRLRVVLTQK